MKELVWNSALQLSTRNQRHARGVTNTASSVAKQMSAAFVKPRSSSWTLIVFPNVGSAIIQTMHSTSAQLVLRDAWSVTVTACATSVTAPHF